MTRFPVALAILAIALPCRGGAQIAGRDARIEILDTTVDQDYSINTAFGQTVFVMLAPGEIIETVAISDPSIYQLSVTAAKDGVYLRQRRLGAQGSMTINAGARRFVVVLTSDTDRPTPYVVSFHAPDTHASPIVPPPAEVMTAAYKLGGDKHVRPLSVSDDGTKTYIRWAQDQSIPAVFALAGAGREETINGYMRDGAFTIDRVYPHLIFRIDKVEAYATRLLAKGP